MKHIKLVSIVVLMPSCATLSDSLSLGSTLGAVAGGLATTMATASTQSGQVSASKVLLGAGIGSVAGLVTSYFVHKNIDEKRQSCMKDEMEMHFGDLPPSPFIFKKKHN